MSKCYRPGIASTFLKKIQYQALRLCTGALKTTGGNGGDASGDEKDSAFSELLG